MIRIRWFLHYLTSLYLITSSYRPADMEAMHVTLPRHAHKFRHWIYIYIWVIYNSIPTYLAQWRLCLVHFATLIPSKKKKLICKQQRKEHAGGAMDEVYSSCFNRSSQNLYQKNPYVPPHPCPLLSCSSSLLTWRDHTIFESSAWLRLLFRRYPRKCLRWNLLTASRAWNLLQKVDTCM